MNIWRPSGRGEFRVLTAGEPFFVKTHFPHNRVVGGGFYSGYAALRLSEAWDCSVRRKAPRIRSRCAAGSAGTGAGSSGRPRTR